MPKGNADKVVATREVVSTFDYDRFKIMDGNRNVDEKHVKQLQKLMLENGNLTYEFPIIVDKDNYVIDGQHRLEALKQLSWEVGYMVEESATINTVRSINRGNRNWTWQDIADSYAKLGNQHYIWFLQFMKTYPQLRFSPALGICGKPYNNGGSGQWSQTKSFQGGGFEIDDKAKAHDLAKLVTEVQAVLGNYSGDLTYALINIVKAPEYNHDRMLQKAKQRGDDIPARAKRTDFMRSLEDMYNYGYPDDNRSRLF